MRCYTETETSTWIAEHSWPVNLVNPDDKIWGISARMSENFARVFWFSSFLAQSFINFEACMLQVAEWRLWLSSGNLHLFYRLRETYGERRFLNEAPGHLFLKYEQADLASFIQLGILSGWEFYLCPTPARILGFVSHDGWFELYSTHEESLEMARKELTGGEVAFKTFHKPFSKCEASLAFP